MIDKLRNDLIYEYIRYKYKGDKQRFVTHIEDYIQNLVEVLHVIDIIETKRIKARIDHFCFGCGGRITAGNTCRKRTLVDGEIYHLYFCNGCEIYIDLNCSRCNECFDNDNAFKNFVKECEKKMVTNVLLKLKNTTTWIDIQNLKKDYNIVEFKVICIDQCLVKVTMISDFDIMHSKHVTSIVHKF